MQTHNHIKQRLMRAIELSDTDFTACDLHDNFEVFGTFNNSNDLAEIVNSELGCKGTYIAQGNYTVWAMGWCLVAMQNSDWTFEIIITE